ncbi:MULTISPECIES: hypothetical protein [unclassified Vibrio]|uniref:hypothetical protein n=1 Tax=unclassified Vibrio TaxID=2614977 RepID=UPI001361458D|nr:MULTISPECIES: hypothetical protein [unclassified Vibrio]NAW58052.1 hypothetical protein [Vibrio sp. V36_P2S2PM302]NAX26300.1 hypothetical protein [Vibrio sp. V38_P2S17PM301]NAX31873.1 hypothetical protein [Vibrio sp. V37_P2S8PM304]
MTYKYVNSPYDIVYKIIPPLDTSLGHQDVPAEELEMREILEQWYFEGLLPVLNNHNQASELRLHRRLKKFNRIVMLLLKNDFYGSAAKRIVSQWPEESFSTRYIRYLIEQSEVNIPAYYTRH